MSQNNWDLTGCFIDIMCSAIVTFDPGSPSTARQNAGLDVAFSRSECLGRFRENMHFGAQYRSRFGRPAQSIRSRYLSVYASTQLLPATLQHSIPGLELRVTRTGFAPVCQ